jgi:predicted HNH restriction endonuclease
MELRTGIRLHEVRLGEEEGFLSRQVFKAHPVLARAMIMRMPTGTVFPLEPTEAAVLEALWAGFGPEPDTQEIVSAMEGRRVLSAHFRRERSSFLRRKKIESVREVLGHCACEICGLPDDGAYPERLADYIFEVHHRHPLHRAVDPVRTTLDDLALLCASCHRAVHATRDMDANFAELFRHFR